MLTLHGNFFLPQFRQDRLLQQLQQFLPSLTQVYAEYIYFVDTKCALTLSEKTRLEQLLGIQVNDFGAINDVSVWVLPRQGTLSSWSTKATNIAHNCGLQSIERIERGKRFRFTSQTPLNEANVKRQGILNALHDRMTEQCYFQSPQLEQVFSNHNPAPLETIDISQGLASLEQANQRLGLALAQDEMEYLLQVYQQLERSPTDAELMMFAQANSEHCRHKIFNAEWEIDQVTTPWTLFKMIKHTYERHNKGVLSAYKDNSSVIQGNLAQRYYANAEARYGFHLEDVHILFKVETHNHPTAISPFEGAATGVGGEIRDEGATGSGAKPKAGLVGFSVSDLRIPDYYQPWESTYGKPERIASALDIMLEAPLGGAQFNNEFGRPNLVGYFRTFEQSATGVNGAEVRGYHKPIMIAGGYGNIKANHVEKSWGKIPIGAKLIVLGGPAMQIGLGGSAASSQANEEGGEALDFASVQRSNPEMERRCQEVIDRCWERSHDNPICFIHDVGAGGLSNALPELLHDGGLGGHIELRDIPCDEPGMSPLALWCNESQERYVLAVPAEKMDLFTQICERERCPFAVVGTTTETTSLVVSDRLYGNRVVDFPLKTLLDKPPKMTRKLSRRDFTKDNFTTKHLDLNEIIERVLRLPSVASKGFLITIGDRSVTGMVVRDQMVGPWQIPVSDCAVTTTSYLGRTGEAMAVGERTPVALIHPPASGRLAVAEVVTNLAGVCIGEMSHIKLSANWMAAAGHPGEDQALYDTVEAVALALCPQLGLTIPVGKDSLSMRTSWQDQGKEKSVTAPMSVIMTGVSPVADVTKVVTPELKNLPKSTKLILLDLGGGQNRLGGSALAQVYRKMGRYAPDLDHPSALLAFWDLVQTLVQEERLLAYHDRSDGGVFTTLVEMSFAGRVGIDIDLSHVSDQSIIAHLFSEELGAVLQVRDTDVEAILAQCESVEGLQATVIGQLNDDDFIRIISQTDECYVKPRTDLLRMWSETSYRMQALRDNPECARQEYDRWLDANDPGLHAYETFKVNQNICAPFVNVSVKPKIAILREQGVNGHLEMAAAFDMAGFESIDMHMSDFIQGRNLTGFNGLVACGGFSYGDVLGAGQGWAKSILYMDSVRKVFEQFFQSNHNFALGVCNGCQMLANLRELIPGSELWPTFVNNQSERYEARTVMVEVQETPSVLMMGMAGSRIPVPVAHAQGRVSFQSSESLYQANQSGLITLRYVNNYGQVTEQYPMNPNGSEAGMTGFCSQDGRVTIMMPHPERVYRAVTNSWQADHWQQDGPWLRMFRNARYWLS